MMTKDDYQPRHAAAAVQPADRTDAGQRSLRTLLQGLAIDVAVAAGAGVLLVLDPLPAEQLTDGAAWLVIGTSVIKSVLTAAASYLARLKLPPN